MDQPGLSPAPPHVPVSFLLAVSPTSWCVPVTSWASSCSTGKPTCATWPWKVCVHWPALSSPMRQSRPTSTPSSMPSRCNLRACSGPTSQHSSVSPLPHWRGLGLRGPEWPVLCHMEPRTHPIYSFPSDGAGRQCATAGG